MYDDTAVELISVILAILMLGYLFYRNLGKMGYTGTVQWVLTIAGFFPLTAVLEMIYFAFFPWPIHKELKELRKLRDRVMSSKANLADLDLEIDRLRGEMGMNKMKGRKNPPR